MKKIVFFVFLMLSMSILAQDKITEGIISMRITMSSENEAINKSLAMVGDLNPVTYFKGEKSRTELNNPMAGETISIVDNNTKEMVVLMNNPMMGKKYLKQSTKTSEEDLKGITVTAIGETKTVLGYVCKGYSITTKKEGVEVKMTMYTTDKITAPNKEINAFGDKVKGFPMYLEMDVQSPVVMKTIAEVTEVKNENVADSKFIMTIPDGYEKMEMPNAK